MKWKFYKGILPALLLIFGGSLPAKADFFRDIKKGFSKVGRKFSGVNEQCYAACTQRKGCSGNKPSRNPKSYMNCKKNCKIACKKGADQRNNRGNQNYERNNRGNQNYERNNRGNQGYSKSKPAAKWGYRDNNDNQYDDGYDGDDESEY